MKPKEQVVFDIRSEKFRYLMREEHDVKSRVNIDELNKRLNKVKKLLGKIFTKSLKVSFYTKRSKIF